MAGKSSRSAHKTAAGGRADYPLDAGRAEVETSGKRHLGDPTNGNGLTLLLVRQGNAPNYPAKSQAFK